MLVLLIAASPLAVLAVDVFGDVGTGAQFKTEIEAIALAGITTGCTAGTPPNYCPDDTVTRKAMAAFMRRGFGRATSDDLSTVNPLPTSDTGATWTTNITPGLPAGALTGAAGFVKVDATVRIDLTNATGCPCTYDGRLTYGGSTFSGSTGNARVTLTSTV